MKNTNIFIAIIFIVATIFSCKEKQVQKTGMDMFKDMYKTQAVDEMHKKSLVTFGFADDKGGYRDTLNQGIRQYEDGSYDDAKGFLVSVKDSFDIASTEYALANYYYGLTCMETESYSLAIEAFTNVEGTTDKDLRDSAKWHRLLCYMATESERTKEFAKEISLDNTSPNHDEAKAIYDFHSN